MFRIVSLLAMTLFSGLLWLKSAAAQPQAQTTEVVFSEVTRVQEEYNDCQNNGNTYLLLITGTVNGEEKTVGIGQIEPFGIGDTGKARDRMAAFCEKAALLTKSQPDKYDLYFKSVSSGGGGGGPGTGICPSSGSSSSQIAELICELR